MAYEVPRRRGVAFGAIALSFALLAGTALAEDRFLERLEGSGIQTFLPEEQPKEKAPVRTADTQSSGSSRDAWSGGSSSNSSSSGVPTRSRFSTWIATVDFETFSIGILWTLGIIAAVLVVGWLLARVRFRREPTSQESGVLRSVPAVVGPEVRAADENEIDALARAGRFAEAIHALLAHALVVTTRRTGTPARVAATSRELLALLPLEKDARRALGTLVATVEITHFGGIEADRAKYEACRSSYLALAHADRE